eukprot:gene7624-8918_t
MSSEHVEPSTTTTRSTSNSGKDVVDTPRKVKFDRRPLNNEDATFDSKPFRNNTTNNNYRSNDFNSNSFYNPNRKSSPDDFNEYSNQDEELALTGLALTLTKPLEEVKEELNTWIEKKKPEDLIPALRRVQWSRTMTDSAAYLLDGLEVVLKQKAPKMLLSAQVKNFMEKISNNMIIARVVRGEYERAHQLNEIVPAKSTALKIYALSLARIGHYAEALRKSVAAKEKVRRNKDMKVSKYEKVEDTMPHITDTIMIRAPEWTRNMYMHGLSTLGQRAIDSLDKIPVEKHGEWLETMLNDYRHEELAAVLIHHEMMGDLEELERIFLVMQNLSDGTRLNATTNLVIQHYLHMARYEMALHWYSRRYVHDMSPDLQTIFSFIHHHAARGDEILVRHWHTVLNDNLLRPDAPRDPEADSKTLVYYYQTFETVITAAINSLPATATESPIVCPSPPEQERSDRLLEQAIAEVNASEAVYTLQKYISKSCIPSGTALLRAQVLVATAMPRNYLKFVSSVPADVRIIMFQSAAYSRLLSNNLDKGIEHLRFEHPIMQVSPKILNFLVCGLCRSKELDLTLTFMSKMVRSGIQVNEDTIATVSHRLIETNLFPESVLNELTTFFQETPVHIRNCHLNNMIYQGDLAEAKVFLQSYSVPDVYTNHVVAKMYNIEHPINEQTTVQDMAKYMSSIIPNRNNNRSLYTAIFEAMSKSGQGATVEDFIVSNLNIFTNDRLLDVKLVHLIAHVVKDEAIMLRIFKHLPRPERYTRELSEIIKDYNSRAQDPTVHSLINNAWTYEQNDDHPMSDLTLRYITQHILPKIDTVHRWPLLK